MVRKILSSRDPLLRRRSKEVPRVDKKIISLIKDLKDTLRIQKDPEGVGLAAPQIGKAFRVFVMVDSGEIRAVINPEVITISQRKDSGKRNNTIMEGCLSLPHFYGPLKRAKSLTLKYLDEEGKQKTEDFVGFTAQIVQHEIDHLNGVIFVDRLLEQKKPLYRLVDDEWEEVEIL